MKKIWNATEKNDIKIGVFSEEIFSLDHISNYLRLTSRHQTSVLTENLKSRCVDNYDINLRKISISRKSGIH